MKEMIIEFLNYEYRFTSGSGVNHENINSVFSISNNNEKIGFIQIEKIIIKVFNLDEDIAHALVFNWLLYNGVKLVRKNWNKMYMVHNHNYFDDAININAINVNHRSEINLTIQYEQPNQHLDDFEYKIIPNE